MAEAVCLAVLLSRLHGTCPEPHCCGSQVNAAQSGTLNGHCPLPGWPGIRVCRPAPDHPRQACVLGSSASELIGSGYQAVVTQSGHRPSSAAHHSCLPSALRRTRRPLESGGAPSHPQPIKEQLSPTPSPLPGADPKGTAFADSFAQPPLCDVSKPAEVLEIERRDGPWGRFRWTGKEVP